MIDHHQPNQYLTFQLGTEVFAICIARVREVLDVTRITKVPQMSEELRGIINLRGSMVPVVDLRQKFKIAEKKQTQDTCIIIVEIELDNERVVLGAMADAVQEVLELTPEQIEPAPRIGSYLRTEFIHGMGKRGEEFVILLDIDRVFGETGLSQLAEAHIDNSMTTDTPPEFISSN